MKLALISIISLVFINCTDRIRPDKRVYFKDDEADICYSAVRFDPNANGNSGIDSKSVTYVPCTEKVLKLVEKYK